MLALRASPCLRPAAAIKAPRLAARRAAVVPRASTEPTPEPTPAAPATPIAEPVVAKTVVPTAGDVMAFGGAAPELVNGRLAQLGFIAALGAELSTGESVFQQLGDSPAWILYTFVLFIGASLIPIFKGAKSEAFGPFSPKAELINGRAAMIGFAALLAIEAVKGSALF